MDVPPWQAPEPAATDPFGLAWVTRLLGEDRTAGLPPSRAHAIKLYSGLTVASVPPGLAWAAFELTAGNVGLAVVIVLLLALTVGGVALLRVAPGTLPVQVHLVLAVFSLLNLAQAWAAGGIFENAGQTVWFLFDPVLATLLVSRGAGLAWLGVALVGIPASALLPDLLGPPPFEVVPGTEWAAVVSFSGLAVLLTASVFWFVEQRRIAERMLEAERARTEALLHNVLPEPVARRLRAHGAEARQFEDAGVLFADVVGFTPLSASMDAPALVELLDDLFRRVDALTEQHGLCKIKTIGDCYMVASGIPTPSDGHLDALARFALDLRALFDGHPQGLQVRIGMAAGPVVAGVIGRLRLLYDLWGDTVNTASRMESHGVPGRVHLTRATADRLRGRFRVEDRGEIEVKGKGRLATAFLLP